MIINFLKHKNTFFVFIASLLMPSLLLPIKYSSILLVIIFVIIIYKLIVNRGSIKIPKYVLLPFICYYISIIISFFIDVNYGIINFDFLLRNISIIIVPLFVFTSNFDKNEINKILKFSSIIISLFGIVMIIIWCLGYNNYFKQQEFKKSEWIKSQILPTDNSINQDSILEFNISPFSKTNSFRRIGDLSNWNKNDSIIRELTIKVKESSQNVWVYFRNFNDNHSQGAWFNAKTGQIGFVQKGVKVESEALQNGYFKFTLKDKPRKYLTREWFYFSFVNENGYFKWNSEKQKSNVIIQLKTPKFYLSSGEDLLKKSPLFSYKITNFSSLKDYAHGTYMSLIFVFSTLILLFKDVLNKWTRYVFILTNTFIIFSLASKAVIISLIVLFPLYYFKYLLKYKYIVGVGVIVILIGINGYATRRFDDMYQTLINIDNKQSLGDLEYLSTNERLNIYENYFYLINKNLLGYGYVKGKNTVKSIFNHDFNSHNQYIQSLFNSGVLGFLFFILFCLSPFIFIKRIINKKNLLRFFILIIFFNFLFESILFRQWGLILVSFTFALYFQKFKSKLRWCQ